MESQRRALSVRTAGSANTTLSIMRGGANTWAECRPNRIGIQPAGKIFLLTFPFIGHVHAHHPQSGAAPLPQLLGEKLLHRFFRPILAHPQEHATFQSIDHREIDLTLSTAYFIDANHVYRRPLPMPQAIAHRPLHNPGHRLPVQTKMPRGPLPTQFPRQAGRRIGQGSRDSGPRLGPCKTFHPHATTRALHPAQLVAQDQTQLPHRKIPPLPPFPDTVHPAAWLPANAASQSPIPQPIDLDDHALFVGLDFDHSVGFQAQLFSDKRFNQHLGSCPFCGCVRTAMKGYRTRGALLFVALSSGGLNPLNPDYTFRIGTTKTLFGICCHQRGISSPLRGGFPPRRFMILSKALKSARAFRSAKNSATCRADSFSATAVATN